MSLSAVLNKSVFTWLHMKHIMAVLVKVQGRGSGYLPSLWDITYCNTSSVRVSSFPWGILDSLFLQPPRFFLVGCRTKEFLISLLNIDLYPVS